MRRLWIILAALVVILVLAVGVLIAVPNLSQAPTAPAPTTATSTQASLDDLIVVDSPLPNAKVEPPLHITGKARGSWYFEAVFPVYLTDWDGRVIAQGQAHAQGDWMTQDYVPFAADLTFTVPPPGDPSRNRGTLVLHNDNPSGDPSRDKALEIPVEF